MTFIDNSESPKDPDCKMKRKLTFEHLWGVSEGQVANSLLRSLDTLLNEWNGMEWNGMEWNGMEWNGMDDVEKKIG